MRLNVLLHVQEIYALENAVFCIAVYGLYKPYISHTRNKQCSNATEINCTACNALLRKIKCTYNYYYSIQYPLHSLPDQERNVSCVTVHPHSPDIPPPPAETPNRIKQGGKDEREGERKGGGAGLT